LQFLILPSGTALTCRVPAMAVDFAVV